LLEFLEAERTYLEIRGQYLRARHDLRQASVDVAFVVAEGNLE
jgi:outer membrane protein TolC